MILRLRREEKPLLNAMVRYDNDPKMVRRAQIVLGLADGKRPVELARTLRCSRSTVYRVADTFKNRRLAGLFDRRSKKASPLVEEGVPELLCALVPTSPREHGWERSTWSCELLSLVVKERLGLQVHVSSVHRLLRAGHFAYKSPRPTLVSPDPNKEAIIQALEELKATLSDDEVLCYEDEMDVHLNPRIGRMWMPKGQQYEVVTPGNNKKHYVAGALNHHTGELTWVDGTSKNSLLFVELCLKLLAKYPDARRIHVICDNAITHHSKMTEKALAPFCDRLVLHFLPTYSPEENRIERLWQDLHACVTRNHNAKTIEELMERVHTFLHAASPFPGNRPSLAKAS
jgi:transposase